RDAKLIVIHDETVDRTTNGHGRVDAMSLEELRQLDAGQGQKIPTLQEILAIPGARLVVEMKHVTDTNALADATVAAIHDANMQNRVVLASFDAKLLARAHERDPSIPLVGFAGDEASVRAMVKLPLSVLGVSTNVTHLALTEAP